MWLQLELAHILIGEKEAVRRNGRCVSESESYFVALNRPPCTCMFVLEEIAGCISNNGEELSEQVA